MNHSIPHAECINTETALRKEWLDVNALGAYSSSTILDCHTRKYHGLLVVPLSSPEGNFVLLSKVEPSLMAENKEFFFSTNKYPIVYHPTGHMYIESFNYDIFPTTYYRMGEVNFTKSVLLLHNEQTLLIKFEYKNGNGRVNLRLRFLTAYRSIHELVRQNLALRVKTFAEPNGFKFDPYQGMPPLYIGSSVTGYFHPGPRWYYNVEYLKERRRGYDYQEDLFCPGVYELEMEPGQQVILGASLASLKDTDLQKKFDLEVRRRRRLQKKFDDNERLRDLKMIGSFFINKNTLDDVVVTAGHHWHGNYGRDTMIAVPGLAFCSKRTADGLRALKTFVKHEKDGRIPDALSLNGRPLSYNQVDTSFWLFWTLQQYLVYGGNSAGIERQFSVALQNIIRAHIENRLPFTTVLDNGLLFYGDAHIPGTWMNAVVNGLPVTPRHGCAVEVNALWYNALRFWEQYGAEWNLDDALVRQVRDIANAFEDAFSDIFWDHENKCLIDVWRQDYLDRSIRPNQIFAVSLPYSALSKEQQIALVERVRSELVTSAGLRTLSPGHSDYRGYYQGDAERRDRALHQGTVWPWLTGAFGEAALKNAVDKAAVAVQLHEQFESILLHFPEDFCIMTIPEIYSGNPPPAPKGAVAHACATAEIIRLQSLLEAVK